MNYFCSYFDFNYLSRALVLYRSLERTCRAFHLFGLCMDDEGFKAVEGLKLPWMTAVRLAELEQEHPDLLPVKAGRSRLEYYYTCGPSFCLFLLNRHLRIDLLSYVDADLMFFCDPQPLFDELEGYSVGIIEHRFSKKNEHLNRFGLYNVGWMSFRRDRSGLECLQWWRERCIEWCYDRIEGERCADQKYLEEFPQRFNGVRVIQHKGANVAPWNIANYKITEECGRVLIDDQPLIFFHFHGFRAISSVLWDTNLGWYGVTPSTVVRRRIFGPYISGLRQFDCALRNIHYQGRKSSAFLSTARLLVRVARGISRQAYIVTLRDTGQ